MKKLCCVLFFCFFAFTSFAGGIHHHILEELKGYTLVDIFTLEDIIESQSNYGQRFFVLSKNYQTQMTIEINDFQLDPCFLSHSTAVYLFGATGERYKLVIKNKIYKTEIIAPGASAGAMQYWQTKANGIIHNSTCQFFRKYPGKLVRRQTSGRDCKKCGGRRK